VKHLLFEILRPASGGTQNDRGTVALNKLKDLSDVSDLYGFMPKVDSGCPHPEPEMLRGRGTRNNKGFNFILYAKTTRKFLTAPPVCGQTTTCLGGQGRNPCPNVCFGSRRL